MSLYRALYMSRTIVEPGGSVEDMATHIAQHAALHNAATGLSGVLLYSPDHYMQVLEGERALINDLLWRLYRDSRHAEMELISFTPVDNRLFGPTPMRLCQVEADQVPSFEAAAEDGETERGGISPDAFLALVDRVLHA